MQQWVPSTAQLWVGDFKICLEFIVCTLYLEQLLISILILFFLVVHFDFEDLFLQKVKLVADGTQ